MLASVLEQLAAPRLPAAVVVALILIVAANALALLVSVWVARRIRAIGDAIELTDPPGEHAVPADEA